jgi:hypothetical protein
VNGETPVRRELFQPTQEGEARLLLLIDAFSSKHKTLEGRTKLAKLDFLLRYPAYFNRALAARAPRVPAHSAIEDDNVENRMVRYRYGPWDPSYFALLGTLIGKGLIETIPIKTGTGYRTTFLGKRLAKKLMDTEPWCDIAATIKLLRSHFDLNGSALKSFLYDNFPEIASTSWGHRL